MDKKKRKENDNNGKYNRFVGSNSANISTTIGKNPDF